MIRLMIDTHHFCEIFLSQVEEASMEEAAL